MRQQHPMNVIQACFSPTRWLSSMFLLVSLASFYLQVPMSAQSLSCCRDLSSVRALSIAIFSLVWGLTLVYYLWLRKALCCSDGCARISSALPQAGGMKHTQFVEISWCQPPHFSTIRQYRHHVWVQNAQLGLLTSRYSIVYWEHFLLVPEAFWYLPRYHHVYQVLNLSTQMILHLPPPLLLSLCGLCICDSS